MKLTDILKLRISNVFLQERISLLDLAIIALDSGETGWTEEDGPKKEMAKTKAKRVTFRKGIMNEYFLIVIDKVRNLRSL